MNGRRTRRRRPETFGIPQPSLTSASDIGSGTASVFDASRIPRYLQLADLLRQRIARGHWPVGAMLPSIDSLMAEFAVGRITVRQAIGLLHEEGLVSPERGRGTLVQRLPEAHRQLRVHTTLSGLVDMYRNDLPVLTNLEESQTSPELRESDGRSAGDYVHMRRVHARDNARYCVISLYIAESLFLRDVDGFRSKAALPVLCGMPGIEVGRARQTMRIAKADAEIARLLGLPVGDPTAEVRRVLCAPDDTVIYVADVIYRGDYIHLDMDLKP